ncbi:MAG: anaerobic ribonucleoside-triphosphate reductase activating protein [Cetobacterium sp.]|uniref:anaerobic ribonucleoside-triphosphate reductase activating protein n=1 Tax=Cetobacterium sp. TaxID=2071632 RepID=UPI003F2DC939
MKLTGKIQKGDMVNGPGLRVSIFVSGCEHHCPQCFSKHTWDKENGYEFDAETKRELFEALSNDFINGISILGGDPLATYNRDEIYELCKEIREKFPKKTIYIWTGYTADYLKENFKKIIEVSDMIITDMFVEEFSRKNGIGEDELYYRGSKNQKYIIDGEVFDDLPIKYKLSF